MPYKIPANWLPNEPLVASKLNAEVRDIARYLLYERPQVKSQYFSALIGSTSTVWADVSTANAQITVTLNTGNCFVWFLFPFYLGFSSSGEAQAHFRIQADASGALIEGDATYGITGANNQGSGVAPAPVFVPAYFTNLSQGSHIFRLQWKMIVVSGSGYVMNIPSVAGNHGAPLRMGVLEG